VENPRPDARFIYLDTPNPQGALPIMNLTPDTKKLTPTDLANHQRAVLQGIIDGCVHPETAKRRVMVELAPIRAVLALKIDQEQPSADQRVREEVPFCY
jgi:hypothetical protein